MFELLLSRSQIYPTCDFTFHDTARGSGIKRKREESVRTRRRRSRERRYEKNQTVDSGGVINFLSPEENLVSRLHCWPIEINDAARTRVYDADVTRHASWCRGLTNTANGRNADGAAGPRSNAVRNCAYDRRKPADYPLKPAAC